MSNIQKKYGVRGRECHVTQVPGPQIAARRAALLSSRLSQMLTLLYAATEKSSAKAQKNNVKSSKLGFHKNDHSTSLHQTVPICPFVHLKEQEMNHVTES